MHIPIMVAEVVDGLALAPGLTVIDATCGLGGHTRAFARAVLPSGKVVAFEKDARNIVIAQERLREETNVTLIHESYEHMEAHVAHAHAIFFDFGFSSLHVDDASRGFSFLHDGPLDMRYDTRQELTAEHIVNSWAREDLAWLLRTYGEEPRAQHLAKIITLARKKERITTTRHLAEIIENEIPRRGKIHPATLTFQALRIAVNDELGTVARGIAAALRIIVPGGRIAALTFHSHEDRIVKRAFLEASNVRILTKKPLVPSRAEQLHNPRSRSAKLRILEKL